MDPGGDGLADGIGPPADGNGLRYLQSKQKPTGSWDDRIPFVPTFHALAKVEREEADRLFRQALPRIEKSRNRDGTWGRSHRENQTRLVMDALQRKKVAA